MRALTDLLLGESCVGCRRPGGTLCPVCEGHLRFGGPHQVPLGRQGAAPPVWAARPYSGVPRALVIAHKERGVLPLARPLGILLAGAVAALLAGTPDHLDAPVVLVPVPSRPGQTRRRRHDPVLRTARAAAGLLGEGRSGRGADAASGRTVAAVVPALRHRRPVSDQAGLGRAERAANLAGALGVPRRRRPAAGAVVVVVDDVCTTGATLAEACRALAAAGRPPIGAAVVCAAESW